MKNKISKIMMVVALVLFAVTAVFGQDQNNKPEKVDTKIIVINGDNDWKNTGIILKSNDRVTIKATGEVLFSDGNALSSVTPDGMSQMQYRLNWEFDAQFCNDPMKNLNHAALIGKAGKGTFLIGEELNFTGKSGPFSIGINDCTFKDDFYNTGKFNVSIKIIRGK